MSGIIKKILGGSGGSGLTSLSADTTPQLGGTLDLNGQSLSATLEAATGDETALDLSVTVNKATSGNYTGIKLNVTETAAPGTANLLADIQAGGTSAFKIGETTAGQMQIRGPVGSIVASGEPGISFLGISDTGIAANGSNLAIWESGVIAINISTGGARLSRNYALGWSANADNNATDDLELVRDAAGVLRITGGNGTSGGSLKLDLTTEDRAFVDFNATADADATSAISTLTTSGATTHHIQVEINGVTAWIAASTTDPS